MNNRTKELAKAYYEELHAQFPNVSLIDYIPSLTDNEDTWIAVTYPESEEEQLRFSYVAAKLTGVYLEKYNSHIVPLSGHLVNN